MDSSGNSAPPQQHWGGTKKETVGNRRNGQRPFQPLPQHQGGESHPAGLEGKAATPPPSTEGMGMWGGSRAADDPALPSWDVAAASRADADNAGMVVVVVVVGGVKGGAGGASNESANLGFPRGEGSGATYGARKALVAAPAAALAAAVRTAWLEKTPAANSSWAFWKLAPVRRYREWILFSIIIPSTACAVKSKDTRIIITATALFVLSAIRLRIQPLKPQFGIPIACRTYTTFWAKKMKKKTKKLNELSLLNALYMGRYQQTKEQGV